MKYQTEYQRNYQKRTPRKHHELTAEERKLSEVPSRRSASSPSRRRGRAVPASADPDDATFAMLGPNEKFSQSQLYRMKQPVKDYPRAAKSQEYALLGKNSKFENNVVYPLRKPVISDSPRVVVRRRKSESHSCGIQTNLKRATSASFDPRHGRNHGSQRRRNAPQTEYKQQYDWKLAGSRSLGDPPAAADPNSRERRPDPRRSPPPANRSEKASVAVNTPARVEIDVNRTEQPARQAARHSTKQFRPKRDDTTEYRTRYQPIVVEPKQPSAAKAFEAKRHDAPKAHHTHSDDEGTGGAVDLGTEFRQKYPHGKLRRWKSEYQSTYKPFWRFDYKNGKWYKDTAADEKGFNPNLYWYKELVSTRKRADEFRSKAETDHFNPDHTLQLKTGFGASSYQAWDVEDDRDDDSDSVISIDRDLERERIEGERRRERDARQNEEGRVRQQKPKQKREQPAKHQIDQVAQTDRRVDRVVYVDEPPVQKPSAATKAFVRNLGSSSVQQHMSWDSDSLCSQPSNSDIDSHRRPYTTDNSAHRTNAIRRASPKKHESRGAGTHSPLPSERPPRTITSPHVNDRTAHDSDTNAHRTRPATSYAETANPTSRPSYESQSYDRRPHSSMNEYCTYPASRFKDEVTDYYYGGGDNKHEPQQSYAATPKFSHHHHVPSSDAQYGRTYNAQQKDDDVLSVNSARSLSSSCSLASQTLERANKNMNKYWGENSPSAVASPKKTYSAKH